MESIVLNEQWSFLRDGMDRKCVRIKGHKVYVNMKLYGHATPDGFCKSPNFGEVAPALLDLETTNMSAKYPLEKMILNFL